MSQSFVVREAPTRFNVAHAVNLDLYTPEPASKGQEAGVSHPEQPSLSNDIQPRKAKIDESTEHAVQVTGNAVLDINAEEAQRSLYSRILANQLSQYSGQSIDVSFRSIVGPLPASEATHSAFPYPARLLRQIPRMLLNCTQITDGIDRIIDPFCGSGTVLVEAQLRGIESWGIEQNPMGALASRVKTTPIDTGAFLEKSASILERAKSTRRKTLPSRYVAKWYTPEAFSALARLRSALDEMSGVQDDVASMAFALTAKRLANTDPRIYVPVRRKTESTYSAKDVWETWALESARLVDKLERIRDSSTRAHVLLADSRQPESWDGVGPPDRSLIFTSPPYGAAQKYIRSTSLELGWLGFAEDRGTLSIESNNIGREHLSAADNSAHDLKMPNQEIAGLIQRIASKSPSRARIYAAYFADMANVLKQFRNHASRVVLVSGTNTVSDIEVATHELLGSLLKSSGFTRTLSLRDEIRSRGLLTKRNTSANPASVEYIDLFEQVG